MAVRAERAGACARVAALRRHHDRIQRPRSGDAERGWLYVLVGGLWASGIAWLVLDLWFARAGERFERNRIRSARRCC
ncbi:MAG: hypothetical protein U1F35_14775 [Steroidobacteraceae bacterium]